MRNRYLIVIATLAVVFCLTQQAGQAQSARGPSTPQERAQAVRLTRALESDPLNKDAKNARRWLFTWLTEVPDISVTVNSDYLKPLLDKSDKNYSSELFTQMMFSSAAFIIENPDKAKDEQAVDLAGLEGTLKAYEAILKDKPKAKWEFLDTLIAKRDKGELAAYVAEISKNKSKSK